MQWYKKHSSHKSRFHIFYIFQFTLKAIGLHAMISK